MESSMNPDDYPPIENLASMSYGEIVDEIGIDKRWEAMGPVPNGCFTVFFLAASQPGIIHCYVIAECSTWASAERIANEHNLSLRASDLEPSLN